MASSLPLATRLWITLAILVLFAIGIGLILELKHLVNTHSFVRLMVVALVLGLVLGGVLAWRLSQKVAQIHEKVQVYVACMALCAAILPFLAGWTNRILSVKEKVYYQFVEQEGIYSFGFGVSEKDIPKKANRYTVWLAKDGELYRYSTTTPFPKDLPSGQEVLIWERRGFWGFPVIEGLVQDS